MQCFVSDYEKFHNDSEDFSDRKMGKQISNKNRLWTEGKEGGGGEGEAGSC